MSWMVLDGRKEYPLKVWYILVYFHWDGSFGETVS